MLFEARQIVKTFGGFHAVDGVSMSIDEGEVVGLIGPNGAGKSTFFGCLTGDISASSGHVLFRDRDVTAMRPAHRARLGIAHTFQVPEAFGHMSVRENVMVGALLRETRVAAARKLAQDMLEWTGLGDMAERRASSLSTPSRKRLEIARALATRPAILLLDEAMAGLTPTEIRAAIDLVRSIHERGITLVIVEHVMEVITSLTERVVVLHQGKKIAEGTPADVMRSPQVVDAYLGKRAAAAVRKTL